MPTMRHHIQRAIGARSGRLAIFIAALFAIVFFALPEEDDVLSNHLARLSDVLFQRKVFSATILSSASAPGTAENGASKRKAPSPVLASRVLLDQEYSAAAALAKTASGGDGEEEFYLDTLPSVQGVAFFESSAPASADLAGRAEIYTYIVEENDTPAGIADLFGLSLETLLWANDLTSRSIIRPGEKIVILPVNGVAHVVAKGDTVADLAKKYRASAEDIVAYNNLSSEKLIPGASLIIPDAVRPAPQVAPRPVVVSRQNVNVPVGWLIQPATGRNPRPGSGLHGFNGVDIANSCGTHIVAPAAGVVIVADDIGWNGGYGKYIKIQHPNGVITLYGHLKELLVGVGVQVGQGEAIALMGTSGRSTGCHLHFEVRGAKNPFTGRR